MLVKFLKEKMKPVVAYVIGAIAAICYVIYSVGYDVMHKETTSYYVAMTLVFAGLIALIAIGIAKKNKVMTLGLLVGLIGYMNLPLLESGCANFENAGDYFKYNLETEGTINILMGLFAILLFVVGVLFILGKFVFKNRQIKEVLGYIIVISSVMATIVMIIATIMDLSNLKWEEAWYDLFYDLTMILYPAFIFTASALTESFKDVKAE